MMIDNLTLSVYTVGLILLLSGQVQLQHTFKYALNVQGPGQKII